MNEIVITTDNGTKLVMNDDTRSLAHWADENWGMDGAVFAITPERTWICILPVDGGAKVVYEHAGTFEQQAFFLDIWALANGYTQKAHRLKETK